jgi:hypothetical protein
MGDSESPRRKIMMLSMALSGQVCTRESVERKPWTAQDGREIGRFLAQSVGLVCAAIFLYSVGPACGMALAVGSLAVWSLLRSRAGAAAHEDGPDEDGGHADTVNPPARCADPAWLKNGRLGMSMAAATHPVQRQGA